jgi:hypothetical protein
VAELADALDSGSSAGNGVEVRILSWAPNTCGLADCRRPPSCCDLVTRFVTQVSLQVEPIEGFIQTFRAMQECWSGRRLQFTYAGRLGHREGTGKQTPVGARIRVPMARVMMREVGFGKTHGGEHEAGADPKLVICIH